MTLSIGVLVFLVLSYFPPDVQIVTIADDLRQLVKVATAGDNIMLVCGIDVKDKADVIWQRNGVDLVDVQLLDGMKVRQDLLAPAGYFE